MVFVKKQFYVADAQYTASVSRTQVSFLSHIGYDCTCLIQPASTEPLLPMPVQSMGSARSTASRESEFGLRLAPKVSSNGTAVAQVCKRPTHKD